MKREIKFRAWIPEKMRMVYFDPINQIRCFDGGDMCLGEWSIEEDSTLYEDDFTLMQYTGLKDRNGEDIYEGDIIQIHEKMGDNTKIWNAAVNFSCGSFSMYNPNCCERCKNGDGTISTLGDGFGPIEVIGNIHEDPELLKEM